MRPDRRPIRTMCPSIFEQSFNRIVAMFHWTEHDQTTASKMRSPYQQLSTYVKYIRIIMLSPRSCHYAPPYNWALCHGVSVHLFASRPTAADACLRKRCAQHNAGRAVGVFSTHTCADVRQTLLHTRALAHTFAGAHTRTNINVHAHTVASRSRRRFGRCSPIKLAHRIQSTLKH